MLEHPLSGAHALTATGGSEPAPPPFGARQCADRKPVDRRHSDQQVAGSGEARGSHEPRVGLRDAGTTDLTGRRAPMISMVRGSVAFTSATAWRGCERIAWWASTSLGTASAEVSSPISPADSGEISAASWVPTSPSIRPADRRMRLRRTGPTRNSSRRAPLGRQPIVGPGPPLRTVSGARRISSGTPRCIAAEGASSRTRHTTRSACRRLPIDLPIDCRL